MFEQQLIGDVRTPRLRRVAMGSVSVTLHIGVLAALWLALLMKNNGDLGPRKLPGVVVELPRLVFLKAVPPREKSSGGGDLSKLPVSRGDVAPAHLQRTFILPVTNPEAQLKVQVSMPPTDAPDLNTGQYGDPNAQPGMLSFGMGGPNGMGPYGKGGVGGGPNEGSFRMGDPSITAPILVLKVEPDYTDEARRVKLSGKVMLKITVDIKGVPSNIIVVRPLGFGLDERAKEAVQNWRFRPGLRNGSAVPVEALVEVSFRLL
jgi:protein TonB